MHSFRSSGWRALRAVSLLSTDSPAFSVKQGIVMLIPSLICSHFERYNVFELLSKCSYDMNLGFLTYTYSQEIDWNLFKSSRYPYHLNTGLVSCSEESVKSVSKHENDTEGLADRELSEAAVVFLRVNQCPCWRLNRRFVNS